jgi:hypothetical protein
MSAWFVPPIVIPAVLFTLIFALVHEQILAGVWWHPREAPIKLQSTRALHLVSYRNRAAAPILHNARTGLLDSFKATAAFVA